MKLRLDEARYVDWADNAGQTFALRLEGAAGAIRREVLVLAVEPDDYGRAVLTLDVNENDARLIKATIAGGQS
jgi:hypothetical protein